MLKFLKWKKHFKFSFSSLWSKLSSLGNILAIFITLFVLVVILVLSYFGPNSVNQFLSSLSNVFPKSTPKPEVKIAEPLIPLKNYNKNLQNGPFSCPTIFSLCEKDGVYKNNSLSGKIGNGSPVFAAFEGEAEALSSTHPKSDGTTENFNLLILINKERGLQANYYFKGKATAKKTTVKESDNIGTVNGEPISFMENQSFVFKLIKTTQEGGKIASLSAQDFR
ncbi:MAG: hypothetical protein M1150_04145 [Patescibacteria group bacterium]|nr:hypothetical protein [Patescibacteria group bacterium]